MVIQPIYNILFLPDVTYHFKKEFFTENASEQLEVGSELLFAFLRNEEAVAKIFKEIAPKYTERNGGYTRIIKTDVRRGDSAELAIIELV